MAQVGSSVLANDFNTFYTRLNTIRKNHSLGTLSRSVSVNSVTQSSTMQTLQSDLSNTSSASKYLTTTTYDLKSIAVGDVIKYETYSIVDNALTVMENTCVHDSANYTSHYSSNYGDDYDEFGDNSANADYST